MTPRQQTGRPASGAGVLRSDGGLFLYALIIRWLYALLMYVAMGRDGIMSGDSYGYLRAAEEFAHGLVAGTIHGWDWLGSDLAIMPMFPLWAAFNVLVAGALAPLTAVLSFGMFDAAACVVIRRTAATIAPRFAFAAGLAAAINPTQIVLSGILYTDTMFVFFVALSLLGAVRWLKAPSWNAAIVMAIGLGGASLVRVVIVPWMPVLLVFLLVTAALRRTLGRRHIAQLAVAGAVCLACIAPVLARNVLQYGSWALTPQGGVHLALWVVPLVQEAKDGTPWAATSDRLSARYEKENPSRGSNPFEDSARIGQFGRAEFWQLGLPAIAKAWVTGAMINLAAPGVILSPAVSTLPRTGFYDTRGASTIEKITNFLFRSDNALYAWVLLIGVAGVGLIRLLQLAGLMALLRRETVAPLLLLIGWIGYILAINGPVASPKYRLPIEPALAILTAAGVCALRDWRRKTVA